MERITFIGSGNVATNLAKSFFSKGFEIVQICSSTFSHAEELASLVGADALVDAAALKPADVFIIAVNDGAIAKVAGSLPANNALVLHTAGSVDMRCLQRFANHGVLYPLQTFTKEKEVDLSKLSFFIEANTSEGLEKVRILANALSTNVMALASNERLKLHVAAVFACNFLNYMLSVAADLSREHFFALRPLVDEMVAKAFTSPHPRQVQTGPAVRNDTETMKKHKELLSSQPALQEIYNILSEAIANQIG